MGTDLKATLGDELWGACKGNHRQDVGELLDKRVAATESDPSSILAALLTAAVSWGAVDVIAFCLERGAAVTELDMVAIAASGSFASHQVLIRAKAIDIDYVTDFWGDMLGVAATHNNTDWARFCLENGADPNFSMIDLDNPVLATTAKAGLHDMVELLLQHGAQLRGSGAIVLAAGAGQIDMVRLLLAKGADVNEVGVEDPTDKRSKKNEGTPLHRAIIGGHVETAKLLIAAGASLELKDFLGRTPKMLAEQCPQTEIRLLLAKGVDVNEVGVEDPTDERSKEDVGTPLHRAIIGDHDETARLLIGAAA